MCVFRSSLLRKKDFHPPVPWNLHLHWAPSWAAGLLWGAWPWPGGSPSRLSCSFFARWRVWPGDPAVECPSQSLPVRGRTCGVKKGEVFLKALFLKQKFCRLKINWRAQLKRKSVNCILKKSYSLLHVSYCSFRVKPLNVAINRGFVSQTDHFFLILQNHSILPTHTISFLFLLPSHFNIVCLQVAYRLPSLRLSTSNQQPHANMLLSICAICSASVLFPESQSGSRQKKEKKTCMQVSCSHWVVVWFTASRT